MRRFSDFVDQARSDLPRLVTSVLEHQLQHAAVYYVAHNLAAAHHRSAAGLARIAGQPVRAKWHEIRAFAHRQARRRFRRLVEAKDRAAQCAGVLSCLEM